METWLLVAVFAQFLSALTTLVDKHIVTRAEHIGKPIVYAFYISLLSGFVIVLLPFGIVWQSGTVFLISLVNAAAFVAGIYFLYSALSHARASDVSPAVGGISAIVTIILAALWIDGDVTPALIVPVLLLASGTAIISHFHFSRNALVYTVLAGISFGVMIFLAKVIYLQAGFLNGFFWTRMPNVALALALLFVPRVRRAVFHGARKSSRAAKGLVLGNKILGGVASALTSFAVSLGPVSVVNALSGLQFVFLFVFSFLFGKRMPTYNTDKIRNHGGWHSAIGITFIVCGLAALYLA